MVDYPFLFRIFMDSYLVEEMLWQQNHHHLKGFILTIQFMGIVGFGMVISIQTDMDA